jgi:hypothetical protein
MLQKRLPNNALMMYFAVAMVVLSGKGLPMRRSSWHLFFHSTPQQFLSKSSLWLWLLESSERRSRKEQGGDLGQSTVLACRV